MAPRRKFDFRFKERVLQYAEENSGEEAARCFNIDSKRIRYWRKQKEALLSADKRRARLSGGGRKKVNLELEKQLSEWIYSVWDQHERVSGGMIKAKALEICSAPADGGKRFVASRGWFQRFLQRHNLPLQRRSIGAQKEPDLLSDELVSFVDHVGRAVSSRRVLEKDIIAMDETVVWFDTMSTRTGDTPGANSVTLKATEHEKVHLTVVLAAKADGTKLHPYVVFRGPAGEVKALQRQSSSAVISSSVNGCMSDALTTDWLQSVVGRFSSTPRLLVWDSYRCHISDATKDELKRGYNITTAAIPRGCTKYIQAADVMWKQPFKQSLNDAYGQWVAGDADKEYTPRGYLKVPSRRLLVDWVVAAWNRLDEGLIRESFKVCGLSVKPDGSEDDLVLCFREGQSCAAGREALIQARQGSRDNGCQAAHDEEDEEELFHNELVVFDEEEEENDNCEDDDCGEEDSDHMSWHCFIHQVFPSNNKNQFIKEEQQQRSPSLDQEEPPQLPHIKEEQEELWSSQEGEQLPGLEEAHSTKFTFTPVAVKSEDEDEEKPPSSRLHRRQSGQVEREADGDECGGSEPARNSDPENHDKSEDSSEPETEDSDDWTETREPQSALNTKQRRLCP